MKSCPICNTMALWFGRDSFFNYYRCQNNKCPILFTLTVKLNEEIDRKIGLSLNGNELIISYSFIIDNYIIHISDAMETTSIYSENDFIKKPIVVKSFNIDWNNLNILKHKIATIVNFS